MKIKDKDLKILYKAHTITKSSPTREDCPSPEEFLHFFRSKKSKKTSAEIIDHLSKCYYCLQEFKLVSETLVQEEELNQEIKKILDLDNSRSDAKKRKNSVFLTLKKWWILCSSRFSWKYASIFSSTLLFIFIVSILIIKISEKQEYRGAMSSGINLIEPINKRYSKSILIFKWSEMKDSEYYILEIFNDTLYPIWKSNKILKEETHLPAEILNKLIGNRKYYWMVTAFSYKGDKVESRIERFSVIE